MSEISTVPLIAILTDFGTSDPFAGIMKGVIAGIAPGIPLVDLTHEIPPGDVLRAAVTLWQSVPYFPEGTVFLCVVDPGVGTPRHPIIADTPTARFVGPDNGLFSFVLGGEHQAWQLANPDFVLPNESRTFHGRDVFAPAAAHAALGVNGANFGPPHPGLERVRPPLLASSTPGQLEGEVLFADRFGNLLTSLGRFLRQEGQIRFFPWAGSLQPATLKADPVAILLPDGTRLKLVKTFSDAPESCAALIGSSGLIEIVANRRRADELLHLPRGAPIILQLFVERST